MVLSASDLFLCRYWNFPKQTFHIPFNGTFQNLQAQIFPEKQLLILTIYLSIDPMIYYSIPVIHLLNVSMICNACVTEKI
jgi:hypothetical protein